MIKRFEEYINEDYFSKLANRKDNNIVRKETKVVKELPALYDRQERCVADFNKLFDVFVGKLYHRLEKDFGVESQPMIFGYGWLTCDINEGAPALLPNGLNDDFSYISSSYDVSMSISFPKSQKDVINWFENTIVKTFNETEDLLTFESDEDIDEGYTKNFYKELYDAIANNEFDGCEQEIIDELNNLDQDRVSYLFRFKDPFDFSDEYRERMADDTFESVDKEYEIVKETVEIVEAYHTAFEKCNSIL